MSFIKFIKIKLAAKPTIDALADAFVKVQDNIQKSLDFFTSKPQLDSLLLSSNALSAGNNKIAHKLGKQLSGWQITDMNGPSVFWSYKSADDKFLYLYSTNPVTINLLVF